MRNRRNKRKSPKRDNILKILTGLCVVVGLVWFSVFFSMTNMTNDKIIRGVRIEGINVSNLTQEEASKKIKDWYEQVALKNITLNYDELEENINIKEFDAEENIDKVIVEAMSIGRSGNILKDNFEILITRFFNKDFDIEITYNEEKLENKINEISNKLPGAVIQSSYYIENNDLIIKMGNDGIVARKDNLENQILSSIKNENKIIDIPVSNVSIDPVDIDKIHEEIYKQPENAYMEEKENKLHTQVNGIDFAISVEDAKQMLKEEKDEYVIPLKITIPEVTTEMVGAKAFPDKLSEFTTRYYADDEGRSTNIALSTEKINGTIVMPGETFSYNKIVGERTIAKGYKEAPVYSGGKVVLGIGGGICQVSSTLYNAVLYANLDVTTRSNHRFLTSYVKAGRDATVSWGTLDFCFVNTRSYPIKIVANAANGILRVQIYGLYEDEEYEVEIETQILEERNYTTTYIKDSSIGEGQEELQQYGSNYVKSQTYKIVTYKGKELSRTLISTDTYAPLEEVIRQGTGKISSIQEEAVIEEDEALAGGILSGH